MKDPLRKRLPRELRSDIGKYLVIFLLMAMSIAEVSGFLVADDSMIAAYNESFDTYRIEDGNFTLERKANRDRIRKIEKLGVKVYELFYTEQKMEINGSTFRLFRKRSEVNLECLMEGAFPEKEGEIAIDRMFADNNDIRVGDVLRTADGSGSYTVTGLVAMSDYSTLFEKNTDSMFDSVKFCVGILAPEVFDRVPKDDLTWRYAWKYLDPPADEAAEKDMAEDFLKDLTKAADITDFVPRYLNQAIRFTGEDMGSDRAMMQVFLYIIMVILAFVFAVTASTTITQEAAVIGTLRATGYTKRELIRHYMTMPFLVSLAASVVGNILGYTLLKDFNAGLYYGSYSLPTYETRWNADAFYQTTVIPLIMLLIINFVILTRKLSLSPLQFLRRDLRRGRSRRAFPLSKHLPFMSRFRLRVLFQNIPNYLLLAIGIFFANVLLMFGLMLPDVLHHYEESVPDQMLAPYQYILQMPAGAVDEDEKLQSLMEMMKFMRGVETENESAEKFSAYSLQSLPDGQYGGEEILIYGIGEESRYIDLSLQSGDVYISSAYADKLSVTAGDVITLKEKYEEDRYSFTVKGVYPYDGTLAVFMPQKDLNELFELGEDTFTGYFSETPIEDIDSTYVGQVIDLEAMTKISRQLMVSMGSMMYLVDGFSVIMFMILIYLLSKIIIEKNAQSISMTKILGYTNHEISGLYVRTTSIMVIFLIIVSIPLCRTLIEVLFRKLIMLELTGWIPFVMSREVGVKMVLLGIGTYLLVAILEMRKVRSVPMAEALKNAE